MRLKKGAKGAHVTRAVIRPLVERGYLTWRDAGWTDDPREGGRYLLGDKWARSPWAQGSNKPAKGQEAGGEITDAVEAAVRKFQQDSGIYHEVEDPSLGTETGSHEFRKRKVSSGVVGNRTLAALGTSIQSRDTQRLIARQLRAKSAEVELTSQGQGEAISRRASQIRSAYPMLDARVTAALAFTGHELDDPVTKALIGLQMRKGARPIWQDIKHKSGDRVEQVDQLGDQIQGGHEFAGPPPDPEAGHDLGPFSVASVFPSMVADRVGEVVGVDQLGDAIRTPVEWANQKVVKPVARAGFTALQAPYEGVVGIERLAAREAEGYADSPGQMLSNVGGQTTAGQALRHVVRGENVDMGSGYFPAGEVHQEQAAFSRSIASVAGHAWTPGRYAASLITEPGTKPYNVLSGIVDAASIGTTDPVNIVLPAVSRARAGRSVLTLAEEGPEVTGLLAGVRKAIHGPTAETYLTSGKGARWAEKVASAAPGHQTFLELLPQVGGDAEAAARLVDADTVAGVRSVVDEKLGLSIRKAPHTEAPYAWRRVVNNVVQKHRTMGMMPGQSLDLSDIDGAVEGFDRFMRNGKLTVEQRNQFGAELALASGREDRFKIITRAGAAIEDNMIANGVDPDAARSLTTFWSDTENARHYLLNSIGDDVNPFVSIGDQRYNLPHPAIMADFLDSYVPLPDARAIRRATSRLSRLSKTNFYEDPGRVGNITNAVDKYMRVWKPLMLMRPAWGIRVVGEEQLRIAATGNWDHPVHHIVSLIGLPDRLPGGGKQLAQGDALGINFYDDMLERAKLGDYTDYANARSGGFAAFAVSGEVRLKRMRGWKVYSRDADPVGFTTAWGDRLERLHADKGTRFLAANGPEATKEWLRAEGRWYWNQMIEKGDNPDGIVDEFSQVDNWVDELEEHLVDMTRGDVHLRDAIADGKWDGEPLATLADAGALKRNPKFRNELKRRRVEGDAPLQIPGRDYARPGADEVENWNKFVTMMFDHLMTRPTNRLSRSPLFFKKYWARMEELLPGLDDEARASVLHEAEKNGFKDIAKNGAKAKAGTERLTAKEADQLAKRFALNETKQLLYDLGERSTIFDITRNIFPFGEAWKEVTTRWAKIMYEQPENLRRLQVGVEGARGSGFFYTDPTTRQEMFVMPGSEWATKTLTGVPIPLGGAVTGLNIMSQGQPGFGPAAQLSAGFVMPDDPDWDWLRHAISPFGDETEGRDPIEAGVATLVPPWAEKGLNTLGIDAVSSQRDRAAAIKAVASWKRTSGEYGDSPAEMVRLMQDAKRDSRTFWVVRMFGSLLAPTAPIPQFQVRDKKGKKHTLSHLKEKYYSGMAKARAEGREDEFDRQFIGRYGLDVAGELEPISDTAGIPLPRTKKQVDWQRRNPSIASDYPYVYGFFAPLDPDGKYDETAYDRTYSSGERTFRTPEQQARAVDNRKGWAKWREETEGLGESEPERKLKRAISKDIKEEFPGWQDQTGMPTSVNKDEQVKQLEKAVRDPRLRNKPVAKGLREYLDARDDTIAYATSIGVVGWKTAKKLEQGRALLRATAEDVQARYPETGPVFDSVFRDELEEDA